MWLEDLRLSKFDKTVLASPEGMLTNKHVGAAQFLLKKQFPHLEGLQSPLREQNGSFLPLIPSTDKGL